MSPSRRFSLFERRKIRRGDGGHRALPSATDSDLGVPRDLCVEDRPRFGEGLLLRHDENGLLDPRICARFDRGSYQIRRVIGWHVIDWNLSSSVS